jgi:competence protein ComEC
LEIHSIGFIYSFTVVSFIVLFFQIIPSAWLERGTGAWGVFSRYGLSLVFTSFAATIASVPLTVLFFESFSTVSFLANLVVVPLTFCIVLAGWLAILIPILSIFFNAAAFVFIQALLGCVQFLGHWSWSYRQVGAISLFPVLFWYIGWIGLLLHFHNRILRRAFLFVILFSMLWILLPIF